MYIYLKNSRASVLEVFLRLTLAAMATKIWDSTLINHKSY